MKGKLVLSGIEFNDIFCNERFLENEWYKVKFPTKDKKQVSFLRNNKEIDILPKERTIKHNYMFGTLFSDKFNAVLINSKKSLSIFEKKNFPLDESEYIVWVTKNKSKHLNIECKIFNHFIKKIRFPLITKQTQ